ncbi:MAG TPA: NDP-sugar synthase [Actinomycetota bacterium]|jgi:mannose-1-phosphate guanylyltransferase|nr:NDP-sugar synthase [Actinomycetota bacterium]
MTAGAVVFAAGRGKRLRPLTDEVPKPAVPLLDLPLASFALTALRRAGLRTLVNVSHLPDIARSSLEPYAPDAIWFPEPEVPFGTAGTLREASRRGFLQGEVLVWNGDVVADVDPAALLREHHRRGAEATAVVEPCSQGADFLVEDGRAVAFVDRRRDPQAAGVRFTGISVLTTAALASIPPEGPAGLGETVFGPLARAGHLAVVETGGTRDVGTLAAFLSVTGRLLDEPPADPSPPGEIVAVEDGRAYLGPGASAPDDSLGRGAVLLRGARVADGTRVERAVVWPGAEVPPGATVADCVWFRGGCVFP